MNRIIYTNSFKSKAKRLHKKFVSLRDDVAKLEKQLLESPTFGQSLGSGLYKIRLAVESKGGGKSGGIRIISYLINETENGTDIYLIEIYDKSEESTVQKKELLKLVKAIET